MRYKFKKVVVGFSKNKHAFYLLKKKREAKQVVSL